jgi:hypothetical protein
MEGLYFFVEVKFTYKNFLSFHAFCSEGIPERKKKEQLIKYQTIRGKYKRKKRI